MARYIEKLIQVDATQWQLGVKYKDLIEVTAESRAVIRTAPGQRMAVKPGDWIVKGDDGSITVMSDADFKATYEPA